MAFSNDLFGDLERATARWLAAVRGLEATNREYGEARAVLEEARRRVEAAARLPARLLSSPQPRSRAARSGVPGSQPERILEMLGAAETPQTPTQIGDATGIGMKSVRAVLSVLAKSGVVENVRKGQWRRAAAVPADPSAETAIPDGPVDL